MRTAKNLSLSALVVPRTIDDPLYRGLALRELSRQLRSARAPVVMPQEVINPRTPLSPRKPRHCWNCRLPRLDRSMKINLTSWPPRG